MFESRREILARSSLADLRQVNVIVVVAAVAAAVEDAPRTKLGGDGCKTQLGPSSIVAQRARARTATAGSKSQPSPTNRTNLEGAQRAEEIVAHVLAVVVLRGACAASERGGPNFVRAYDTRASATP